jgi:hypothetical protein
VQDSGSGWVTTPFLPDSFILDIMPVYPGAQRTQFFVETIGFTRLALGQLGFASGGSSAALTSDRAERAELREATVPSAKRGAW